MVHIDRVSGQRGHMVIQEDGTILSSSGELASNEMTSNQITSLMQHSLPVDFNRGGENGVGINGDVSGGGDTHHSGSANGAAGDLSTLKWNRVTVQFGDEAYVACLSNRRIHVVKRDNTQAPTNNAPAQQ